MRCWGQTLSIGPTFDAVVLRARAGATAVAALGTAIDWTVPSICAAWPDIGVECSNFLNDGGTSAPNAHRDFASAHLIDGRGHALCAIAAGGREVLCSNTLLGLSGDLDAGMLPPSRARRVDGLL